MTDENSILRLNKFVAKSGLCNRKEAVELIKSGAIFVNGEVFKEPFYEIQPSDTISYKGKTLTPKQIYIYLLLNKPKDIGALGDVLLKKPSITDLIKNKTDQQVYQLFPLADSSCGLTILTNDQELINKYTQNKKISKTVFEIEIDKAMESSELDEMLNHNLKGGIQILGISAIIGTTGYKLGIEMRSGSESDILQLLINKGYKILKSDRTFMNGLTKKDLKRGWSRFLTDQEVIFLKYF